MPTDLTQRHTNIAGVGSIYNLPAIRVTSMAQFEECARNWHASVIEGVPRKDSTYGEIGTAVHFIIEQFHYVGWQVLDPSQCDDADLQQNLSSAWAIIPPKERPNLTHYLRALAVRQVQQVLSLEQEFNLEMPNVGLPIRGHMDRVSVIDGNVLEILDHKTNRSIDEIDVWRMRLQPQLYAWAARQLWPDFQTYRFVIGYVNFGFFLEWDTSAEDEQVLLPRVATNWEMMRRYDASGVWPERLNDNCGYCPIKDRCQTHRQLVVNFQESVVDLLNTKPLHEQYLLAKRIESAAKLWKEELEETLRDKVDEAGGAIQLGDVVFTLERSGTRKAKFNDISEALEHETSPDVTEALRDLSEDLFSVKVGGLDKLIARVPRLKSVLTPLMPKVPNEKATLAVREAPKGLLK